ncbi:methyltransferase family protein [Roseivivax sp.]
MTDFASVALTVALVCETVLIAMLLWSILVPSRRLWPPQRVNWLSQLMVWLPTLAVFSSAILVGSAGWNALDWPLWLRWSVGLPLIMAGNAVVWPAALGIGLDATSGAEAELKTDGFYRWSRNPQYVADMGILVGWAILSATPAALIIATGGVVAFALAPFAEEPWLEEVYGAPYRTYRKRTPRFFGFPSRQNADYSV